MSTVRAELAPTGTLRAAINLSNFLLVSDRSSSGDPIGVSPDMARAVADRLGVPVEYVLYETPGALADTALDDLWDIGNLGAEPERAKTIDFTAAYAEIQATYLVPEGSPIGSVDEVDRDGVRISVSGRSAYGLWLADHIEHAQLVKADGVEASFGERHLKLLDCRHPRSVARPSQVKNCKIATKKTSPSFFFPP